MDNLRRRLSKTLATALFVFLGAGCSAGPQSSLPHAPSASIGRQAQAAASEGTFPNGTPWAIPGTIDFDNYDTGGQGVGYNTQTATNLGGQYRQDGVGIAASVNGGGNGFYVGWNHAGDWYNYTVNVQTTATYNVAIAVDCGLATGSAAGTFHIEDQSGNNLTGEVEVSGTGSWSANWVTVNSTMPLTAGTNVLKVVVDSGAGVFNFDHMTFTLSSGPGSQPTQAPTGGSNGSAYPNGTPWAVPGTLDFDNYDAGGQGVGYNTTVTTNLGGQYRQEGVSIASSVNGGGNGFYVGWNAVGDWYRYTVNVQATATYYVGISVDSGASGSVAGSFHIEDQTGKNLTGAVQVPTTGSWNANWVIVNATAPLSAGANVLKVVVDSGSGLFNLNYMTFSASTAPTQPPSTPTPPPSPPGGTATAPPNAINVQSYGAVNDGQTDDQGALQNAFNAAQSMGRPVWIPPGTYSHSGILTANGVSIQGAGFNTVLNATDPNNSAIALQGGNPSISNLMTTVVAPNRSNQPQTTAIWVNHASNARVSTVILQGAGSNGVRLDGAQHCTVSQTFALGTNADGIAATNGASYNTVANNLVYQPADDAYSDDSYIGEPQDTGNQFIGNVAWDVVYGRGFAAAGSINGLFEGNTVDQTTWVGIYATTDPNSHTQVTSGWTIANDVLLNTVDAPIINGNNMTVSNIQFTGTLPNLGSVLGWDPTPYIVDRKTFNPTYVPGTGPGSHN